MALPAELSHLSTPIAAAIEAALSPVSFPAGERLFTEGEAGDCFYIIDSGQVRLELEREELDGQSVLGFIEPGEIVGEMAMLDDQPRSASAFAQSVVAARRLSKADLAGLEATLPAAGAALLKVLSVGLARKLRLTNDRLALAIFEATDPEIDALVARAVAAQRKVMLAEDASVEAALKDIAETMAARSEELARDTVAATRIGNVADKTIKNRLAAELVYQRSLKDRPGHGVLSHDGTLGVTELAAPVGVVFGLIPMTNPVATAIFKSLICLKSRNALILNFHRSTDKLAVKVVGIVQELLARRGLPRDLVQFVERRGSRRTTELLMRHRDVAFILATGGASMVKAAYSSGKPAIGVGPGNCPTLVCADADPEHAAWAIVASKSFDNGLICGSEHNLITVDAIRAPLLAALERQGAAILDAKEAGRLTRLIVDPADGRFRPEIVGQSAALIAERTGIVRDYPIRLIVVPTDAANRANPWAREKMAPMVSLFSVPDVDAGIALSLALLDIEGRGHTAIIHGKDRTAIERFGHAMPVSRILVNSPGSQGIVGYTTGLVPSFTLGCGTFGGNSTTDNVTFTHLLNIKRMAEFVAPSQVGG